MTKNHTKASKATNKNSTKSNEPKTVQTRIFTQTPQKQLSKVTFTPLDQPFSRTFLKKLKKIENDPLNYNTPERIADHVVTHQLTNVGDIEPTKIPPDDPWLKTVLLQFENPDEYQSMEDYMNGAQTRVNPSLQEEPIPLMQPPTSNPHPSMEEYLDDMFTHARPPPPGFAPIPKFVQKPCPTRPPNSISSEDEDEDDAATVIKNDSVNGRSSSDEGNFSTDSFDEPIRTPLICRSNDVRPWKEVLETFIPDVKPANDATTLASVIATSVGTTFFNTIFGKSTPMFVASITSALIGVGAGLTTLLNNTLTTASKTLVYASIIASLSSFIVTVGHLLYNIGVTFDTEKIMKQLPELVPDILKTPNQANSIAWLYPTITSIISLIIGGLTVFNICDIKTVLQKSALLKASNNFADTAKDFTKFLLDDLLHLDISGNQVAFNELEQWAKRSSELAVISYLEFLINDALLCELRVAVKTTLPKLSHKYNPKDVSFAARGAQQLILSNLQRLIDKLAAIEIIIGATKRQETLGVLLSGETSVGKSTLVEYISREVSRILGYKPGLYSLNKRPEGHYNPYGGQDFGVIEEFMALRSKDPNLCHLNQILSADFFNFEAAHIEGKNQPCRLKTLFLTSNNICPRLVGVLDEGAAEASWDRIIRVEVSDPLAKGRLGRNDHRQPNFSHLNLRIVTSTRELTPSNLTFDDLSIEELIGTVVLQCASRELNYLKQTPFETTPNITAQELQLRRDFLSSITFNDTSNAVNTFNVTRIQGPLGTGKTTIAHEIADNISRAYIGWPKIEVKDFTQDNTKQGIYIIDDLLEPRKQDYEAYFKWINKGHVSNHYILISNHVFERKRPLSTRFKNMMTGNDAFHWEVQTFGVSNGIARRIGLNGTVRTSDGQSTICTSGSTTIEIFNAGQYTFNGVDVNKQELLNMTYRTFCAITANKHTVRVVRNNYAGANTEYDATVTSTDFQSMSKAFASLKNIIASCATRSNNTTIEFKGTLINELVSKFDSASQLMPRDMRTEEELVDAAHSIAMILNNVKPGVKCRMVFTTTRREITLIDGELFIGNPVNELFEITHSREDMEIAWRYNNQLYVVTYEQYNQFVRCGKTTSATENTPSTILSAVHDYVRANIGETDPMFNYHSWVSSVIRAKQEIAGGGIVRYMKNHIALTLVLGIGAILTTIAITKLCVSMFTNKDEEKSNAKGKGKAAMKYDDDYQENPLREHIERYKRTLLTDPSKAACIREEAYQLGYTAEWNDFEYNFRSNMKTADEFNKALVHADVTKLHALCLSDPKGVEDALLCNVSNNLTMQEENHQTRSELEVVQDKLRQNYVRVRGEGMVYGLGICKRMLITVSHAFLPNSDCFVDSEGRSYKARVVRLDRARDIAFIIISDLQFPEFKDIRNMLGSEEDFYAVTHGWFMRPTSKPLILSGKLEFVHTTAKPKFDSTNPYYALSAQFWRYSTIGLENPAKIFKSGDCGFPIVVHHNNAYRIVGIHNALNDAGHSWFTSVCAEDMIEVKSNSHTAVRYPYNAKSMTIDAKMHEIVAGTYKKSVYEGVSPLKVYGYNHGLKFFSNPEHKKKFLPIASEFLKCTTLPSAIDLTNVTDTSALYPDVHGEVNPLFSQAVKYAEVLPELGTQDPEIDKYTDDIIKMYYRKEYGSYRELPLHEVINGFDAVKGLEMSTSVGPKLKKFFGIQTKRPPSDPNVLFKNLNKDEDKPFYVINKETPVGRELFNDYHHYTSSIKQGKPVLIVSKDNAKIELLPEEKVRVGKVRLFNEVDLSVNMMLKTFFGSFLNNVIKKHETGVFCIGTNPYIDATSHMRYFNALDGFMANADYKALDKSTPGHMIRSFVECVFGTDLSQEQKDAIADTLIYRLHTMNGNCYFVDCGNCSGSYVTTLMNCHTVFKASLYTFIRRWRELYGVFPTYHEIFVNFVLRILGDDAIRKYSNTCGVTVEDLISDARRFGLTQTPAKTEGDVSFCSREYVEIAPMIYFPRLKQESITSAVFWFASFHPEQIKANLFTGLLEAALWDEEFYNKMVLSAMKICNEFNIDFDATPYDHCRKTFIDYIRGHVTSPVFKEQKNLTSSNLAEEKSNAKFNKMADMYINEYIQKRKLPAAKFIFQQHGDDHTPTWVCTATLTDHLKREFSVRGKDVTKQDAKREACEKLKNALVTNTTRVDMAITGLKPGADLSDLTNALEKLGINSVDIKVKAIDTDLDSEEGKSNSSPIAIHATCNEKEHTEMCVGIRAKKNNPFNDEKKMRTFMNRRFPCVRHITLQGIHELQEARCVTKIDVAMHDYFMRHLAPPEELEDDHVVPKSTISTTLDKEEAHANADMPIEPATINQSATGQQIATLPSSTNPQPTGVIAAMTSSGEDIMANLQYAEQQVLNPVGAPNMLSVGAITFDLKALIYEQFLDSDVEFEVTDDTPSGGIIFQIPYGVNHPFVNAYIKTYALNHKRYAGAIQYRITTVGNPLFSGVIGTAWQPRKVTSAQLLISEAQKYAYSAKGVTVPWNVIHTLHDGRQSLFYRNTDEVVDDDRPHLVVFLMMSLQNPLREGVITRIRVASKLCNASEPNPFVFSEPIINTATASESSNAVAPQGFDDVFVNTINTPMSIYTDGIGQSTQPDKARTYYPDFTTTAFNSAGARKGILEIPPSSTGTLRPFGPGQGSGNSWDDFKVIFPLMFNFFATTVTTVIPARCLAFLMTQGNMDGYSMMRILRASQIPGLKSQDGSVLTENNINAIRTASTWDFGALEAIGIFIHSVLYNDTPFVYKVLMDSTRSNKVICGGYTKVITNQGTLIFYTLSTFSDGTSLTMQQLYEMSGAYSIPSGFSPTLPYLNIDEQLGFTRTFTPLPLGYQALRITEIPPSSVVISEYPGMTASDNATIARWFRSRASGLPTTQCIQFVLSDAISQRRIATVRYIQESGMFVIASNARDSFRVLQIPTAQINIQSIITINRTNDFAITDTSAWFARTSPSFLKNEAHKSVALYYQGNVEAHKHPIVDDKVIETYLDKEPAKANASLAVGMLGGVASGVGSAIGDAQQRNHEKYMQQQNFNQQQLLQSNVFGQDLLMQGNMFEFQQGMQGTSQDFQKLMQQGSFDQEKSMSTWNARQQRETNREQMRNRVTERGLSARTRFLDMNNPTSTNA